MIMLKDEAIRSCKNFNRMYNKFLYSHPSIVEIKDRNNAIYHDTDWDKIVSLRNIKFPIKTTRKEFYKNQIRVYFNYLVDDGLVLIHKEYLCNKEFYKKRF